ncbi:MAG: hypothetical protein J07HQX50_00845 [Haloquadratum sp. J07HQX50]|jgi:hypothetical protein|nr:MAG: hypothetical protein J07HQX50_00845 [Haloquadratum sp. J07HQX50]
MCECTVPDILSLIRHVGTVEPQVGFCLYVEGWTVGTIDARHTASAGVFAHATTPILILNSELCQFQ